MTESEQQSGVADLWKGLLFLAAAAVFAVVPFAVAGFSLERVLFFFCGAIATKWFIFAIFELGMSRPKYLKKVAGVFDNDLR